MNVRNSMDPATVDPATNNTIGFVSFVGPFWVNTTLGWIGDCVDGSGGETKKKKMIHIHI